MSDKYAVLGILRNNDLHGYEISKRLSTIEGFWYIAPGNLYRALTSLEKEGMVSVKRTEQVDGKLRKIYTITSSGRTAFEKWLNEPASMQKTRHEGYLKIWFSEGNIAKVLVQMKQIKRVSEDILSQLDNFDFTTLPEHLKWIMEAGRKHVSYDIKWAQSCIETLLRESSRRDGV